jgi:AraC-like DNA-binding protein
LEIHIQSRSESNLDVLLPSGSNTKIFLDQPATVVVFPTSILSLPMLGKDLRAELSDSFPVTEPSLSRKIEHLLESGDMEVFPGLSILSDVTGISSRTLQRKLAAEGTSFFDVVDRWRFKAALTMLSDPNTKVYEISDKLLYSNPSNFRRAFHRWTNTTPQRYRESYQADSNHPHLVKNGAK